MRSPASSFWDRVDLAMVRWLSVALGLVDRIFGIQWGESQLGRLADRWQAQLAQINKRLAQLEEERRSLQRQMDAMSIQAAALHLGGRLLAEGELRLDPADQDEGRVLDAAIEVLVKRHLAAIAPEEVSAGHFVYSLEPDWRAIRACLAAEAGRAGAEIAAWLGEGIQFIDRSFPEVNDG